MLGVNPVALTKELKELIGEDKFAEILHDVACSSLTPCLHQFVRLRQSANCKAVVLHVSKS